MTTELISKNITAIQLFSENGLDPVLDKIKVEVDKFEPNTETSKGRKEIASFSRTIASSKVFIEKAGKELVSGIKAKAKLIDAERKRSRDTLDRWRDEVRKPLTEYENAEKIRVEKERDLEIYLIDWDEAIQIDDLFNREKSMAAKEAEFAKIEQEKKDKEESERLEKERIENEAEVKKRAEAQAKFNADEEIKWAKIKRITDLGLTIDGADTQWSMGDIHISVVEFKTLNDSDFDSLIHKIKKEIEKRNNERAEQDRIAAEEKAEADKEAAIQRVKEEAEVEANRKEQQRIYREQAEADKVKKEKAIADKKAANKLHQASVNNKVKAGLMKTGITEKQAIAIIIEVAQGRIEKLRIEY